MTRSATLKGKATKRPVLLPWDVTIGHITFRKGCRLETLVRRAECWLAEAQRLFNIEHPGGTRIIKEIYGKDFKV